VKIPAEVLEVLTDPRTVIAGDRVSIPFELPRPLYEKVDKILKEAGGRWDGRKSVRAHVFPHPVEDFMRHVLLAGEFVSGRDLGWFPTPPSVVELLLDHAGIRPGMTVLEPSAGTGAIAGPVAGRDGVVDCVEVDERRARVLEDSGYARRVLRGNFLTGLQPLDYEAGFDRVVMNPPFHEAIEHVNHALGFLGDDALLVAVLPDGVRWREDRAHTEFRRLVEGSGGEFVPLPRDAFESVGARVHTVMALVPSGGQDCRVRNHGWHVRRPRQLDLFAA
jgi:predicted RNA methylase